jgi:DNA-directed RNA polymerase sigma subunit (sigma70/sigma32)
LLPRTFFGNGASESYEVRDMSLHTPESVEQYLESVRAVAPADEQEVGELLDTYRKGEAAYKRLVESHLALVIPMVEALAPTESSKMEMLQDGNIALMIAIKNYAGDPAGFAPYAKQMIEEHIAEALKFRASEQN